MDNDLWRHENNLPQVIQANEVDTLSDETSSIPLGETLLVEVDHAKETIETPWKMKEKERDRVEEREVKER